MVSEDEIRKVAALMKIRITDHREYVTKVQGMIDYFAILDGASGDDDLSTLEIPLERLREDRSAPYGDPLMPWLRGDRDGYIRAPKMV